MKTGFADCWPVNKLMAAALWALDDSEAEIERLREELERHANALGTIAAAEGCAGCAELARSVLQGKCDD